MPPRPGPAGRYGRNRIECPVCGAAVPKRAGSCPACGHRFHYWYVAAGILALLLLFAVAALVVRVFGG